MPEWGGKLYAGNYHTGTVDNHELVGNQDQIVDSFPATDPKFATGAWVSYADLKKIYVIFNSCKKWRASVPMMSAKEANERFGLLWLDMEREAAEAEKESRK